MGLRDDAQGALFGIVIGVGGAFCAALIGSGRAAGARSFGQLDGPRPDADRAAPIFGPPPKRLWPPSLWLGYGYFAFWLPDDGPAYWTREGGELAGGVRAFAVGSNWRSELAASALCCCFALQLLATRGGAVFGAISAPIAEPVKPAFLAAFTLYTVSESHALQANDLFWTLYVAVAARLTA